MAKKKLDEVAELESIKVEADPPVAIKMEETSDAVVEKIPSIHDAEWSDYVLNQFTEDEIHDGNPNVDGLRRVTEKLLGDIIVAKAHSVAAPCDANASGATVEFTVIVKDRVTEELREVTEVADSNPRNSEAEFALHPSAFAATRAEGRCYRKLLRLRRIITSEEAAHLPTVAMGEDTTIQPNQINFINSICARNDISVMAFINSGTKGAIYKNIKEVKHPAAAAMISKLSGYQREQKTIPDNIKGYDKNWKG